MPRCPCLTRPIADKVTLLSLLFWQMRKPLVERKRRARINESLQELRVLMADADVSQAALHICVRPLLCAVLFLNISCTGVTLASLCCQRLLLNALFHPLQLQSKMENAEVLEMTVKRVEGVLQSRAQGTHLAFPFTRVPP